MAGETETFTDQLGADVYRINAGFDLDEYLCRANSPLDFSINVDQSYGPLDGAGHPAPGNSLYGETARLTLRLFDVDEESGERDVIAVNGTVLQGFFSGMNNQWSIQTFELPTSLLQLPNAANPEGRNDFRVDIDITDAGWCVEVDWADLRLEAALLPVAFLHGITASGQQLQPAEEYFALRVPDLAGRTARPSFGDSNIQGTEGVLAPIAEDLLETAGSRQLNVFAHSMGGLRARQYAWDHPSQVANVVMLGTPNGGGELADLLCGERQRAKFSLDPDSGAGVIGGLTLHMGPCDGPDDPLYQLQTEYVQGTFNKQVPDRFATRLGTIAGEGINETAGFIAFAGPSDGTVTVDSVNYLNVFRSDHPGRHFSASDRVAANHSELIQEESPGLEPALCFLYRTASDCPAGPPEGSSAVASDAPSLPAVTPSNQVFTRTSRTIPAGGAVQVPVDFESAPVGAIVVVTGNAAISALYQSTALGQGDLFGVPALGLSLPNPTDGTLTITNGGTTSTPVVIFASVETDRVLTLSVPSPVEVNSSAIIMATLTGYQVGDAVSGAVTGESGAKIADLAFVAGDPGQWSASFVPTSAEMYFITAWIDGPRPRTDSALLTASSGRAQILSGISEELLGTDDGLADTLRIQSTVSVQDSATYAVAASLAAGDGTVVATAGTSATLTAGTHSVGLDFDGAAIYESGRSGPYTVGPVTLSRLSGQVLVLEDEASSIGSTAAHSYASFQHFPVEFDLAGFADKGIDANADGVFEALEVTGSVRVDIAGTYIINARLLAPNGEEVGASQQSSLLSAGTNAFRLVFDGEAIAAAGRDGPYTVADLSAYPAANADQLGYLITAHQTQAYSVADFGGVSSGTVWSWGWNEYGQLARDSTDQCTGPADCSATAAPITATLEAASVHSGQYHSFAILTDGRLFTWGRDSAGQLGDGVVGAPDSRPDPTEVTGLNSVVSAAGGSSHSVALRSDGTVWTWGLNASGQLGDGTTTSRATPGAVPGLSGVVAIGAGQNWTLAVRADGTVWAWGANTYGQLGDGTTKTRKTPVRVNNLSGAVAVDAGTDHSIALLGNGSVWSWGRNNTGQIGDNTQADRKSPVRVFESATAIAAGGRHTIAARQDGTVWAWGDDGNGQLGNGPNLPGQQPYNRNYPVQSLGISTAVVVAAGSSTSAALTPDGELFVWGSGQHGEFGDGTIGVGRYTPTLGPDIAIAGLSLKSFGFLAIPE